MHGREQRCQGRPTCPGSSVGSSSCSSPFRPRAGHSERSRGLLHRCQKRLHLSSCQARPASVSMDPSLDMLTSMTQLIAWSCWTNGPNVLARIPAALSIAALAVLSSNESFASRATSIPIMSANTEDKSSTTETMVSSLAAGRR